MSARSLITVCACTAFVSGCTTHNPAGLKGPAAGPVAVQWERPNSTRDELQADIARCDYEVTTAVPPAKYHPFATNVWVVLQDQININETAARARGLMEKCLTSKGWAKVIVFSDGTTDRPTPVEFTPRKLK